MSSRSRRSDVVLERLDEVLERLDDLGTRVADLQRRRRPTAAAVARTQPARIAATARRNGFVTQRGRPDTQRWLEHCERIGHDAPWRDPPRDAARPNPAQSRDDEVDDDMRVVGRTFGGAPVYSDELDDDVEAERLAELARDPERQKRLAKGLGDP